MHASRRIAPKGDFGTVYSKNPGIASGCTEGARNLRPRQKPKFHKALRDIGGKIDAFQNAVFALLEFR
jgi:hypothetical protein